MLEKEVISTLLMDRAFPLGNSIDKHNRRALHVKIANDDVEPVPVKIDKGTDLFLSGNGNLAPNSEIDVITYVPGMPYEKLIIEEVFASVQLSSIVKIKINGVVKSGFNLTASRLTDRITFRSPIYVLNGETLKVTIEQRPSSVGGNYFVNVFGFLI